MDLCGAKAQIGYYQARIAELEAENERLSQHNHLLLCGRCSNLIDAREHLSSMPRVNPSGDTLGRKERDDG